MAKIHYGPPSLDLLIARMRDALVEMYSPHDYVFRSSQADAKKTMQNVILAGMQSKSFVDRVDQANVVDISTFKR